MLHGKQFGLPFQVYPCICWLLWTSGINLTFMNSLAGYPIRATSLCETEITRRNSFQQSTVVLKIMCLQLSLQTTDAMRLPSIPLGIRIPPVRNRKHFLNNLGKTGENSFLFWNTEWTVKNFFSETLYPKITYCCCKTFGKAISFFIAGATFYHSFTVAWLNVKAIPKLVENFDWQLLKERILSGSDFGFLGEETFQFRWRRVDLN
jgi:hypothetical protein